MKEYEKELIRQMISDGYGQSDIRKTIWSKLGISRSTVAIWKYRKKLAESANPEQND